LGRRFWFTFEVNLKTLITMFNSKIIIGSFIFVSLLFVGFLQMNLNKHQKVKIVSIYEDVSNLDVSIEINKKSNILKFNSTDKIDSVLIFDSKGKMIRKEKPTSNTISIKELKKQELFISFISSDKIAFKSILY